MMKGVYYLKMALLRKVYKLSEEDESIVVEMANFIAIIYSQYWFKTPSAVHAGQNDLRMLSLLQSYEDYIDDENYAREKKLGIWEGTFVKPKIWRKENRK